MANNVSTHKAASTSFPQVQTRGTIDKLEFYTNNYIRLVDFEKRVKSISIPGKPKGLNDRHSYIAILENGKECGIYVRRYGDNFKYINHFITNPSFFNTYKEYLSKLHEFITPGELSDTRISRLDLTVDYNLPFNKLITGIDILYKSVWVNYLGKSQNITGMLIGKGSEKFNIYDKTLKSTLSYPCTRIECQLRGEKLPFKEISKLTSLITAVENKNPFDIITVHETHLNQKDLNWGKKDLERYYKFEVLIENFGFYLSRKILNPNRNFKKEYSKFFWIEKYSQQPSKIILVGLGRFFEQDVNI